LTALSVGLELRDNSDDGIREVVIERE